MLKMHHNPDSPIGSTPKARKDGMMQKMHHSLASPTGSTHRLRHHMIPLVSALTDALT